MSTEERKTRQRSQLFRTRHIDKKIRNICVSLTDFQNSSCNNRIGYFGDLRIVSQDPVFP